jgi:hypothetical protein
MSSTPDRYCRQRKLSEIGDAGQLRISRSLHEVRGADGAIIEAEYLHRAGVERLTILPRAEPEPFVHESYFQFFASRRIAAGAWRALSKLRRELGLETS